MRTGTADLPLHSGKAPQWLMRRMIRLSRAVVDLMAEEFGTGYVLRRLADPFWFQAFGCLLGFDWHSSGLTTTVCGALKVALQDMGSSAPLFACGGKGATSRRTPQEITDTCQHLGLDAGPLIQASRLSAKVDSAALQDGFRLYHHTFFFDRSGRWAVVQQGMAQEDDPLGKPNAGFARRYHWLSEPAVRWTSRPEAAICTERKAPLVVDLVAEKAGPMQEYIIRGLRDEPQEIQKTLVRLPHLKLTPRHAVLLADINPRSVARILLDTYRNPPADFAALLGTRGVGPATLRALALTAELIYGCGPSYRDPARYSFAHGGKDGTPYPVNRRIYDETIETLNTLLSRARLPLSEQRAAFRRLANFSRPPRYSP